MVSRWWDDLLVHFCWLRGAMSFCRGMCSFLACWSFFTSLAGEELHKFPRNQLGKEIRKSWSAPALTYLEKKHLCSFTKLFKSCQFSDRQRFQHWVIYQQLPFSSAFSSNNSKILFKIPLLCFPLCRALCGSTQLFAFAVSEEDGVVIPRPGIQAACYSEVSCSCDKQLLNASTNIIGLMAN